MQKIFITIIFIICQLISYSVLARTEAPSLPIHQVKTSDFIEKFNNLNKQYQYNLATIEKPNNLVNKITYFLTPNIYLTIYSEFELVTGLKITCDRFANNKSDAMNKCQQSIQLISKAFDPDFKFSDFEHNGKRCGSTSTYSSRYSSRYEVYSCSYEFNNVEYKQEHGRYKQAFRFIISPYREYL